MRIYFDIDGILCEEEEDVAYDERKPYPEAIAKVNALYGSGHYIIIFTGRGTVTGIDWRDVTERQLKEWGVKYHELIFGKPDYDILIDNKTYPSIAHLNNIF